MPVATPNLKSAPKEPHCNNLDVLRIWQASIGAFNATLAVADLGLVLLSDPNPNSVQFHRTCSRVYFCGGREKVGKSNNFKNELTMFTP
jgi:hypothetical protein